MIDAEKDEMMAEEVSQETDENIATEASEDEAQGLSEKVASLNDQLLRTLAENQNLRRRAQKDVEDAHNYAIGKFVKDLLVVADNFERALELIGDDLDAENKLKPFVEGIELTQKELQRVFEKHNVERHMPLDEPFDHNLHQALFDVPSEDKPAGTVVQVIQPGYSLNKRLLRPAMVGVAKSAK